MKICIASQPDGTFLVYEEADHDTTGAAPDPMGGEAAPNAAGMGSDSASTEGAPGANGQTAQSVDEALSLARDLLSTESQGDAEAMFTSGFASARGEM